MARQREVTATDPRSSFGATVMASLIVYGIMALGVFAAVGGFILHEHNVGKQQQLAIDAPKIAAATARATTAEAANVQAANDLATMKNACALQEQAVIDFKTTQDRAVALSQQLLAKLQAGQQATQQRIDGLKTAAVVPSGGDDCANTETILRGVAADLLRNQPAADK